MKGNIKYETGVGLVFITAMVILGYYTVVMSQKYHDMEKKYYISVFFDDVGGLNKKDKVKVNGVESGFVDDIELRENRVWVSLEMYNRFAMYENYSIRVRSDAALGGKHVSIFPGRAMDIAGRTHALVDNMENLNGVLDDPLGNISDVISENRENIYVTIMNIREITDKINSGKGTIGKLINKDQLHADADDLVKDMREAIEDSREQAPITSFIRAALTIF